MNSTTQKQFEELLDPILSPAFGMALHLTKNRTDAEDLVQEVSLKAFQAFHSFTIGTNFKAWFFRILTNQFLSSKRKEKSRPEEVELTDISELYLFTKSDEKSLIAPGSTESQVLSNMGEEDIRQAMEALPVDYRMVCSLYFLSEFSYEELSAILEIPIGTVRSRIHRGRKMLQKALWDVAVAPGIVQKLVEKGEPNVL